MNVLSFRNTIPYSVKCLYQKKAAVEQVRRHKDPVGGRYS